MLLKKCLETKKSPKLRRFAAQLLGMSEYVSTYESRQRKALFAQYKPFFE